MIDLKKTLKATKITGYQFAKDIGRNRQQVYGWINGDHNISNLMQDKIMAYLSQKGIRVITK